MAELTSLLGREESEAVDPVPGATDLLLTATESDHGGKAGSSQRRNTAWISEASRAANSVTGV
jgi:hypothetical protein